jgi:hypothetical protein
VLKLGFGCMRLPLTDPKDRSSIDIGAFKQLVDTYMEIGFNYFDTAYRYCGGNSERALREALVDRYPRESYILTTKLSNEFMKSKEEQERVFNEQFEKLGAGYFDYYLLHNQGAVNYKITQELDSIEFIKEKKERGLVKHIGMSYHDSAKLLDEILTAHPELEAVQLQINYLDWENESIQSRKCYEVARIHGKKVFVMEPVKGGTLANVPEEVDTLFSSYAPASTPASWAIRFAASHEGVDVVLSGMNTMEQLLDNIGYMKDFMPMNEDELRIVGKAAEIIRQADMIPCTGCRYCTDTCPKNIPIPDYLSLVQHGHSTTQFVYYLNYSQGKGKAGDCIECRQCEEHCPQHIEITKHLKDISKAFDGFKGWR